MNSNILLNLSIKAAQFHEIKKQKRGHDREIPYFTHPLACAMWVLEDHNGVLTTKQREIAALTLLFHDVLEDTDATEYEVYKCLIEYFDIEYSNEILKNIKLCTLAPGLGSKDEYEIMKTKDLPDVIWYVKLVDKYFNLFGSHHYLEKKGMLDFYKEFLNFLAEKCETTSYSGSKFISQAKCLANA